MSKLIFFVDDDRMIINLLEYTFHSRKHYSVRSFYSGEECIGALSQNPDIIVLDHMLSGQGEHKMDGLETLRQIKKINKEIPVIVLTGFGSDDLLSEFMKEGAERFLTKDDYFIDSLIDAIADISN